MKIEKSDQTINPFGGINFISEEIKQSKITNLIDKHLGFRSPQAIYSYSDIITALWSVFYCGGDCAEDINEHLKEHLQQKPGSKIADADTILRVLKSLKTDNEQVIGKKGSVYKTNQNDNLNNLNINILKHTGLIKEGCYYDFDYDNEVLQNGKTDAKKTYKMTQGYFPGMATIKGMPVYFENRDGNMNVKYKQEELLERAYKMLSDNGIKINRSRMDCGSYTKPVVDVVEKYSRNFYIRAMKCKKLEEEIRKITDWEQTEINFIKYEVSSIDYQPFNQNKKTYRLVIMRRDKGDSQLDLFTGDKMEYRTILTDDWESTDKEIIEYYNKRGTEEKAIDIMNNDFGWKNMPFSFMEENTVFLIIMMICKNIYTYLIGKLSLIFNNLRPHYRLKKFIFRFITVPAKWIKRGGQMKLKIFSNRPYELLAT